MKTTIVAAALAMTAGMASAADLTVAGQTISAGAEFDMNYTTGTDVFALDFTPTAGLTAWGVDFSVDTTIDILDINDGDNLFTGLDFEAGKDLATGLRAYAEVSTDEDLEFGDITTGISFSFQTKYYYYKAEKGSIFAPLFYIVLPVYSISGKKNSNLLLIA